MALEEQLALDAIRSPHQGARPTANVLQKVSGNGAQICGELALGNAAVGARPKHPVGMGIKLPTCCSATHSRFGPGAAANMARWRRSVPTEKRKVGEQGMSGSCLPIGRSIGDEPGSRVALLRAIVIETSRLGRATPA